MSRREIPLDTAPRLVEPQPIASEVREEADLRPRVIDEFIGQADLIAHLRIMLTAAKQRNQVADHVLFAGPPGLGKTSLAGIVASEMGVGLRLTSGPILTRPGDLAAILTDLQEGDVLFIDEIHRLPRQVEEVLYPAMEDRRLDVLVGRGPSARSIRLELPAFTLVGATTRTGLVAAPLRDRFGFIGRLDLYDEADLACIVARSAALLDYQVETTGAGEIARRSRGTPRIANRLLRRVRDVAQIEGSSIITGEIARGALTTFGVDLRGLDKVDRSLLTYLCTHGDGRPVGLVTLAQVVGEEPHTIEEAYEPFLIREGLIARTPRGRVATDAAYEHMGLKRLSGGLL
jgi:holliday junction DNA helicase RuvB